jgi:hypothetical protein
MTLSTDARTEAQEIVDAAFRAANQDDENHLDYTTRGERVLVEHIATALAAVRERRGTT